MRTGHWKLWCLSFLLLSFIGCSMKSHAATVNNSKNNIIKEASKETSKKNNKIQDITPKEPVGSDLKVLHSVTKLAAKRWIQSFTLDSRYYYFIQMTNPYKGHLRITRVKYKGLGRYSKDHMDLKYFGHATNLDCSVYRGETYLWTGSNAASGSDVSRAISCFRYKKNGVLYHHSSLYYKIPMAGTGKYVTNVYPAVNEKNSRLAVRFTYKGKQYYQLYSLLKGTKINVKRPLKQLVLSPTTGDFQGFDVYGNTIYTIEGSPSKIFLKGYDVTRQYQPTVIRTCNMNTKRTERQVIHGAAALPFREPEGIKVLKGKKVQVMFVSNLLTDQSCNIYLVKKH